MKGRLSLLGQPRLDLAHRHRSAGRGRGGGPSQLMRRAELGAWGFMAVAGSGLGRDTTLPRARGALRPRAATRLDCQARTHRRAAGPVQPSAAPPSQPRHAEGSSVAAGRSAVHERRLPRGIGPSADGFRSPIAPASPPLAVLSSRAWTTSSDLGGRACCTLSALGGATLHWPSRGRSLSAAVLGGGRGPRPRRGPRLPPAREGWTSPVRLTAALALVLSAGAGLWFGSDRVPPLPRPPAADGPGPRAPQSEGYLTSNDCRACHPGQYATWHESYHSTMTQVVEPATVQATFEGDLPRPRPGLPPRAARATSTSAPSPSTRRAGESSQVEDRPPHPGHRQPPHAGVLVQLRRPARPRHVPPLLPPRGAALDPLVLGLPDAPRVPRQGGRGALEHPLRQVPHHRRSLTHARDDARRHRRRGDRGRRVRDLLRGLPRARRRARRPQPQPPAPLPAPPLRLGRRVHRPPHPARRGGVRPRLRPSATRSTRCCPSSSNDAQEFGNPYRPGGDLEASQIVYGGTAKAGGPRSSPALSQGFVRNHFWSDGMVRVGGREFNGLQRSPVLRPRGPRAGGS